MVNLIGGSPRSGEWVVRVKKEKNPPSLCDTPFPAEVGHGKKGDKVDSRQLAVNSC